METVADNGNKTNASGVVGNDGFFSLGENRFFDKNRENSNFSCELKNCKLNSDRGRVSSSSETVIIPEDVDFFNLEARQSPGNQSENFSSSSSTTSASTDNQKKKKTKVPDGGWGWMVVFSSFVISMIADGISFSFGLLYIEFLNYFQESKSKTSWIGSLFMAVPLLSGPIMSALVDRYGCRSMTMLGGFISGLGFVIASFGDTIEWEFIFFGVVAGLGLGLCYVTAVVSIAYWFDKYRTLAIGLGACGTGVGTFVYAPLTQFLIEEYGWKGTVLLLAGTFLNMCVCGALMRDPDWLIQEQKQGSLKSLKNASSCSTIKGFDGDSQSLQNYKNTQPLECVSTDLGTSSKQIANQETNGEGNLNLPTVRSVVNLPTFLKQKEKVSDIRKKKIFLCL